MRRGCGICRSPKSDFRLLSQAAPQRATQQPAQARAMIENLRSHTHKVEFLNATTWSKYTTKPDDGAPRLTPAKIERIGYPL